MMLRRVLKSAAESLLFRLRARRGVSLTRVIGVALSVRRLPGGSRFPWYAERNTKTGGGWKAGYKLDGVDGFVVYSGACASVGPDGCKVTYRDVFGGGEGFYLVQVQPVSGDAESQ